MLSAECSTNTRSVLVEVGDWRAVELDLTIDKLQWLWNEMNRYRTLFSDLTRQNFDNFYSVMMLRDSFWIEVLNPVGETIGIIYWMGLSQIIDCEVHIMFFDRKPAEKVAFCKEVAKWFFINFPQFHRMSSSIPQIYHATLRTAEHIGFRKEGKKRQSQLIGGKYVDEYLMGLLASEAL